MTKSPWLSVLVPVYNSEAYLSACLDSLITQDLQDVCIHLYNDGSTDASFEICQSYADRYPEQIKFESCQTNQGISFARNRLLDLADGDYVWFIDSDDYVLPDSVSKARVYILRDQPDMLLCDYMKAQTAMTTFPGTTHHSTNLQALVAGKFKYRKLHCWHKIIRREVIKQTAPFPNGHVFEDIHRMSRLLPHIKSYTYLAEPLVHYRVRDGSIMDSLRGWEGAFDIRKHEDLLIALQQLECLSALSMTDSMRFYISNYVTREYIKAAKRFRKCAKTNENDFNMQAYRRDMEACSPLNFETVAREYLKRRKILLWIKLMRAR